jgi:glycosyltransferase involved in cell wall biosynthesis
MYPLVSVIIPCFRQSHYLPLAVESVFAQSYPAIQIVIVNDGSDDDTDSIARGYGDRVTYVFRQNGGLPAARNSGIHAAKGKYLLFLDSDDLLNQGAIASAVESMAGKDNRLCLMGYRLFRNECFDDVEDERIPDAELDLPLALLVSNPGPPNAYLCSAAMVRSAGGFDESLRSCEDWDLWVRLMMAGAELVKAPIIGAHYRRYHGSMSTNNLRMDQTRAEVLWRAYKLARKNPQILEKHHLDKKRIYALQRKAMRTQLYDAAFGLREKGLYKESAKYYLRAFFRTGFPPNALLRALKLLPHRIFGRAANLAA